jgi:BirA family biotin operon repressor/biotin-[acetyl-CoA-carboxylase] ligase
MNADNISNLLKTKTLGRKLLTFDEIDSTNALALRMLNDGKLSEGMTILADRQSAGKGRLGRVWHSDGGLCMTVAMEIGDKIQTPITLAAGIGVVEGLQTVTGRQFYLKYPNDIFSKKSGGKKFGGILAQSKRNFLILGIGINIQESSFPGELAQSATSLKLLGIKVGKEQVAAGILNSLEVWLDVLKAGEILRIRENWIKLSCTIGNKVTIKERTQMIEGVAVGIDEDGALLVDTGTGTRRITTAEITMEN